MAINLVKKATAYGVNGGPGSKGGNTILAPLPIVAKRAPTPLDLATLGTEWVRRDTNEVWILTSPKVWSKLAVAGAAASFSTLTVDKLSIPTGANASVGVSAAMVAGTTTILTNKVTAASRIFLTHANSAGTIGELYVGVITPGVSFVINSSVADTSTVNWLIIN